VSLGAGHLVGREEELRALVDLLEAPETFPRVAVLSGEAGIGKTTLWIAAVEAGHRLGYRVLASRPSEAEARYSFAGLSDLVGETLAEILPELPAPQRRALESALALSDAEGVLADERVVAFAFLNALRRLAGQGPVLLAVDDLQWLDAPSLALIRFALPRLGAEPVVAVLACRGDVPEWLRRAMPEEGLLRLELGPLSLGALHELLRARLGSGVARPTLRRVWEASRGNPFFALEIARALQRQGGTVEPGGELPIPDDLGALVHERLGGLSAPARDVSRVVAALADPTVELVEAAVGSGAEPGLTDALEARVLELDGRRLRFTHPLLGSALRAWSTPAERRSLHAQLAGVVPDAEEQARHLALATAEPSAEIASVLEDAARRAGERGAPATAAELLEQALRLTLDADVDDARRRILAAAEAHFQAGDMRRANALLEAALAAAPARVARAAVLVQLARAQAESGDSRRAIVLYQEALTESEDDPALVATIHLELARLVRFTEGVDRGVEHAETAVRAASRIDDPALRCRALATFGLLHFNAGRGIPHAEMELGLALERSIPEQPLGYGAEQVVGHQLLWSGELDAARLLFEERRQGLRARGRVEEAEALWYLSLIEWRAGNWEAARRYAAESVALTEQFGREVAGLTTWPKALIAAHLGDVAHGQALAEHCLAYARPAGLATQTAGFEWVLGFLELSGGDSEAALAHFRSAEALRPLLGFRDPGMDWLVPDELDALVSVGELDEVEGVLGLWERRARALDRAWALAIAARVRAVVVAARGDLDSSLATFESALAEHARAMDPFQHARTLLALGATQRRAKRRGAARTSLEHALAIFDRLPAPLWAGKARAELARIGGRAPSRGALTPSEERVAALVAEGRTNREVAADLFITERTVEAALTRVYGKLGVRSRTELAGRLQQQKH
jgi:DNA-binding CsgD family transcriptional regulator